MVEKYRIQFLSSLDGVKIKYSYYISFAYFFHLSIVPTCNPLKLKAKIKLTLEGVREQGKS
jgi:hypothetical protein